MVYLKRDNTGSKREDTQRLGQTATLRDVDIMLSSKSSNDAETDRHNDPGPSLVVMYKTVSGEYDEDCDKANYEHRTDMGSLPFPTS